MVEDRPELVPVDGLRDRRRAVTCQARDTLQSHPCIRKQRDEAVPQLPQRAEVVAWLHALPSCRSQLTSEGGP